MYKQYVWVDVCNLSLIFGQSTNINSYIIDAV